MKQLFRTATVFPAWGVCAVFLLAACGGSSDAADASTESSDETAALSDSGDGMTSAQQTVAVANSFFELDPTLNVADTVAANVTAIVNHTHSQLNGCGTVSVSGAAITVNFGAAPGCTMVNGVQASGSTTLSVSQSSGTTTVAMNFGSLVVGGHALSGSASFATSDGTTYALASQLTSGANSVTSNLTVTASSTLLTFSGTMSGTHSGEMTASQLTAVTYQPGQCYPNGGSAAVTRGATSETITFLSTTPTTGEVTITVGHRSYMSTLPAYGSCPS